jgi:hypothetical protein
VLGERLDPPREVRALPQDRLALLGPRPRVGACSLVSALGARDVERPPLRDGTRVLAVHLLEVAQRGEDALQGLQVGAATVEALETLRDGCDERGVERREARGQEAGELLDVERLRELRATEVQEHVDERGVLLVGHAEEPGIHRTAVVRVPLEDFSVRAERLGEVAARPRALVVAHEAHVAVGPLRRHEEPRLDVARAAARLETGADREVGGDAVLEAPQLQPEVSDAELGLGVEVVHEVPAHRPRVAAERIQALRREVGVEEEREEQLDRLRLSGLVPAAEQEPAAVEDEPAIVVLPHVLDPRAEHRPPLAVGLGEAAGLGSARVEHGDLSRGDRRGREPRGRGQRRPAAAALRSEAERREERERVRGEPARPRVAVLVLLRPLLAVL